MDDKIIELDINIDNRFLIPLNYKVRNINERLFGLLWMYHDTRVPKRFKNLLKRKVYIGPQITPTSNKFYFSVLFRTPHGGEKFNRDYVLEKPEGDDYD